MVLRYWFSIILVAVVMTATASLSAEVIDDDDEAVSLYARGRRLMSEGDWFRAAGVFEELGGRFQSSPNLDLFLFHRGKALYYLGDLSTAEVAFQRFTTLYPEAPEIAYAHFFLANTLYRSGEGDPALASFLEAYRLSEDSRLDRLILASVQALLDNATAISLRPDDFGALPPGKRCPIIRLVAEAMTNRNDLEGARRLLAVCGEEVDPSVVSTVTRQLRQSKLQVALVLPFTGELQTWADDIQNGAIVATEMLAEEDLVKVKLTSHDTHGDALDAARIIADLSGSDDVDLAIGPLTSEAAAIATATLACGDLPLIVPAATQAGLTAPASTAFQLSPNIGLQGIRMAEYAVEELSARTAAIITSTSSDHLRMASAFAERFEYLGGTVIGVEYYRARDKDFGPYIRDLKTIILGHHPDSTFFVTADGDTLDPDGVPARVDCLYMPGDARQLRLMLPQVRFYKIYGTYLGSDGWADDAVYRLGDDVTRQAIFPSPFLGTSTSDEYLEFAVAFDSRYGRQPSRLACLGYDAVQLAARAAQAGDISRKNLVRRLSDTKGHVGASGVITCGPNRENIEMPLYRIVAGTATLLAEPAPEGIGDTTE
jgi:branched-chain amino acid transport system substrate-binding protein